MNFNAKELTIQCPSNSEKIPVEKIPSHITCHTYDQQVDYRQLLELVQNEGLNHYATNREDIRRCPTESCPYFGYTFTEQLKKCTNPLRCEKCEKEWFDSTQVRKFEIDFTNILNNLRKVVLTEPCPNTQCGVLIQKNGGCPHMVCAKCNHQFCWCCKGDFFNYRHTDTQACAGLKIFKNSLIAMIVFMSFSLMIYRSNISPTKLLQGILYQAFVFVFGVIQSCAVCMSFRKN